MPARIDSCIKCSHKCLVLTKPKPYLEPFSQQAGKSLPLVWVQVTLNEQQVGLIRVQPGALCPYSTSTRLFSDSAGPAPRRGRSSGGQKPAGGTSGQEASGASGPALPRTEMPVSRARCSSGGKCAAFKHLWFTLV